MSSKDGGYVITGDSNELPMEIKPKNILAVYGTSVIKAMDRK